MYVCICTATTIKNLEQRYDEYQKITSDFTLKEFKKYADVCQQCCKCNSTIKHCWSGFKAKEQLKED